MKMVSVDQLVPYVNNARTHSPEQINKIRASLREFGFVNPLIIDRDNNVIAGHGRLVAAKAEGYTEVPCVFVDEMTEAQKKAYILADNRMALDAGWDDDLLKVELEALQDLDFDLGLTGFDEKEIADLFAVDGGSEVEDDDFDLTAALEKASFVEKGDLWTVGQHKLLCGDATDPNDVDRLVGGKKANLIVTDPPYGVSFKSSSGLTIQNDSMKNEEFYNFLQASFFNMASHLEKGGAAYVFHADTEGLNFRKACIMKVNYNVTGNERKELVRIISETIGEKSKYLGMPSAAYQIGGFTVSKTGELIWDEKTDIDTLGKVTAAIGAAGFDCGDEIPAGDAKESEADAEASADEEAPESSNRDSEDATPDVDGLTIGMPRSFFTDAALDNLKKLVESKASLIKTMFGIF